MNYYEHHLGDYMRDAAHLSMTEDGAYRRLIDLYYTRETPLPLDVKQCQKLVRCTTAAERNAVVYALETFFERREDGFHQKRCDEEIEKARARIHAARNNGQRGGRPKAEPNPEQTQREPSGLSDEKPNGLATGSNPLTQTKALHLPPPTSHVPDTRKREESEARAARLPNDWILTAERRAIAESERLDPDRTFSKFTDHWKAAGGANSRKRDWDAAWRNWCRTETDRKPMNGNGLHVTTSPPLKLRTADEIEAEERARGDYDAQH
mgnify:CR=1 FL=1